MNSKLAKILTVSLYCGVLLLHVSLQTVFGQETGKNYALLIGGTGWSEEYSTKYHRFLLESRRALIDRFQFHESDVVVLAEDIPDGESYVTGISNAENIRAQFGLFAGKVTPDDYILIILFGHGSFNGSTAKFNIPGRDLSDTDFAELLNQLTAKRIIFVNTTQSSFPFIPVLSAENRIIISATKSGTQTNETHFPGFFVEALTSAASDLDKNGNLTLLEVFTYSSDMTARWFEEANHLATEHPQLEDTGDKQSYRLSELEENAEGLLASITYFKRRISAANTQVAADGDSTLLKLLLQQEQFELDIVTLKSRKNQLAETNYYESLETLLISLARVNEEIEKIKKFR